MYDEVIKTVNLTADEVDLLAKVLSDAKDVCVSLGEEITVETLIDKLK